MTPVISLSHVTKIYKLGDETLYALNDVSFDIQKGECLAIVGPSGSGKSTFANVIGGLDQPDSGTITVNDRNIANMRDRSLSTYRNKHVGFVFQSFNLLGSKTALGNVMVPLIFAGMPLRKRKKRAEECLRLVGLAERMRHKPSQLSGGQRQRVAIARALANDPDIIIADEPTGNLDSKHGAEVMRLLQTLSQKGITVIIITHDKDIARQADRIIEIRDGRIVTGGTHAHR